MFTLSPKGSAIVIFLNIFRTAVRFLIYTLLPRPNLSFRAYCLYACVAHAVNSFNKERRIRAQSREGLLERRAADWNRVKFL